uniref:Putative methyltransferase n=1 Tax=viral metagenome TaxID=1070528 RepID=A0A6M3IEF1_9ZZZZ
MGLRYEPITVEFHRARNGLVMPTGFSSIDIQCDGMEVGEARNKAVEIVMRHEPRPEFLFFLDYDVLPAWDAVTKLFYRARCFPEYDIFAGVYCAKGQPPEPLIYAEPGMGCYWDWTVGDLIVNKIVGCHMGLTLIRTAIFDGMAWDDPDKPLFKTVQETEVKDNGILRHTGTEDLYFCKHYHEQTGKFILVDTSVLAGHINNATGQIFGLPNDSPPVKRAKWRAESEPQEEKELKKALDLGAGASRRQWPGYVTHTTDIRADVKPDFVMDTRWLNLPDASYDLVASSHHLEHFGRYEQVKLWQEMARILKPGGRMEHIVPNLRWAGWKLANAEDADMTAILDVLYGAQEDLGMPRECNTHYMGYTPELARELAEQVAGLVDVTVDGYQDNPALGFNLVIKGRKPEAKEPEMALEVESEVKVSATNGDVTSVERRYG